MLIYIIDDNTEAEVHIYGIDGEDRTERFFISHFADKGIKFLTDEEKEKYKTSADCGIYDVCFEKLAEIIGNFQQTIDRIAEDLEKNDSDVNETYTFDDRFYVV